MMEILSVDEKKCRRDGICAAVCPLGIIKPPDKDSLPTAIAGFSELCIKCGHCVAACPHAALSLPDIPVGICAPLLKNELPDANTAGNFLRGRRSIRNFKDESLTRKEIEALLAVAAYAPTGHNLQPVRWLVIEDKKRLRQLTAKVAEFLSIILKQNPQLAQEMHMDLILSAWDKGDDRICRNAPHLIIAHALKNQAPAAETACLIALTYLELAAFAHGFGACWAGYFQAAAAYFPPLTTALELPDGHQSFGALMLGYPKYAYYRIPPRNDPRVTWR